MEIDWNKVLTYGFSSIAVVVSITTIYITKQNLKKQLRLGKLEEMLEILYYLNGYYRSLYALFNEIERLIKSLEDSNEFPTDFRDINKYRMGFIEKVNRELIIGKISRLKVLSNAYLKNSKKIGGLKERIHTISGVYYEMYIFIYLQGETIKKSNAVIPTLDQMQNYMNNIEGDLIIEMSLGYRRIDGKRQVKYFETQFKKDIELD